MISLREATLEDAAAYAAVWNRANPGEPPTTVERVQHAERNRDPALPWLRILADADGQPVGAGTVARYSWIAAPLLWIGIGVVPEHRRRGIGSALLARLLPYAREHGETLVTQVDQENAAGLAFASKHGFVERWRRFESVLDVDAFDPTPYTGFRERLEAQGITLTTLAKEDGPETRREVHALWERLTNDIPTAFPIQTPAYDQFVGEILEGPDANLEAFILAKAEGRFIGLTAITTPSGRPAYQHLTAVDPAYRGQGLATALKVAVIEYARHHGIRQIRTFNDTANLPMLRVNERLGYRRLPSRIVSTRTL